MRTRILDATTEASVGKVWWYRIPLLLPFAWIFYRHLTDSDYGSVFAGINLAIHEGGHLFLMWFGNEFLMVAGGTLGPTSSRRWARADKTLEAGLEPENN